MWITWIMCILGIFWHFGSSQVPSHLLFSLLLCDLCTVCRPRHSRWASLHSRTPSPPWWPEFVHAAREPQCHSLHRGLLRTPNRAEDRWESVWKVHRQSVLEFSDIHFYTFLYISIHFFTFLYISIHYSFLSRASASDGLIKLRSFQSAVSPLWLMIAAQIDPRVFMAFYA